MTIRPASTDDYQAVSSLLSLAGLVPLDPSSQFGPQYSVAINASQQVVGLAGLERYGSDALLRSVTSRGNARYERAPNSTIDGLYGSCARLRILLGNPTYSFQTLLSSST